MGMGVDIPMDIWMDMEDSIQLYFRWIRYSLLKKGMDKEDNDVIMPIFKSKIAALHGRVKLHM